jgi:LysM repeat protein
LATEHEPRTNLAEDVDDYTINPFGNVVHNYNRIDYINVLEGETIESIANDQGIRPWQIYKYNEMTQGAQISTGQRLYLQPKRRKAEVGNKTHTIEESENMYIISQLYGIKLKHLYRLNNLEYGSQPEVGYTLNLRNRKRE